MSYIRFFSYPFISIFHVNEVKNIFLQFNDFIGSKEYLPNINQSFILLKPTLRIEKKKLRFESLSGRTIFSR